MYYEYKTYDWLVSVDGDEATVKNDLFSISYQHDGLESFAKVAEWLSLGRPSDPCTIGFLNGMKVVLAKRGVESSIRVYKDDEIVVFHQLLMIDRKSLVEAFKNVC